MGPGGRRPCTAKRLGELSDSNLVAFVATPDLRGLVFATTRATRKFENLTVDPRVSMLIDNRCNQVSDFREAMAVTAVGRVKELSGKQKSRILELYLGKHPYLKEFVESPTCALLPVEKVFGNRPVVVQALSQGERTGFDETVTGCRHSLQSSRMLAPSGTRAGEVVGAAAITRLPRDPWVYGQVPARR